jgi:hypothetical protein
MMKLYCSELRKEMLGFAASLAGPEAMRWDSAFTEDYLTSFGGTIEAGTSEI